MRLFVGIDLPPALKAQVGERVAAARDSLPPASWIRTGNLHLTLVFLGDVEAAAQERISRGLAPVFGARAPFRLRITGPGSFPPGRPARVLWVGVGGDGDLEDLQAAVTAALSGSIDFVAEPRPFHAHLTLGRCRQPWPRHAVERWADALPAAIGDPFEVDRGTLFESRLGRDGAVYERRASYRMKGSL